jgi:L,D-peptidoglycan transpeptidase YkuD (ErfK/YbiS/YcfS/YnhG family)
MTECVVIGNQFWVGEKSYPCAIGKGHFSAHKKEGDGCTPIGVFAFRECWYRADKVGMPKTQLPLFVINQNDGWSDDPQDTSYNRHVLLPYGFSHERLWRDDDVYDLIIPLGYNDAPAVAGKGSAIFMHVAKPDYAPTEGCVALSLPDLLEVVAQLDADSRIHIKQS